MSLVGKIIVSALLFLAVVPQAGCGRKNASWTTVVNGLPETVFTSDGGRNVVYYILKQTHEPLFRRDDGQNYTSRILKDWHRDISYSEFVFCPDTALRFDDRHVFSPEIFEILISSIASRYDPTAKVRRHGGEIVVRFDKGRQGFLDFLTEYTNAPSLRVAGNYDAGLGPFKVSSIDKGRIRLRRKVPVRNGYNEIIIVERSAMESLGIDEREISDFNRIPLSDIPDWVFREYVGFNNVVLKTGSLVINHPDLRVRRFLYNCIGVDEFRSAFFPLKKSFKSIQSIFPVGVPGALSGLPAQECRPEKMGGAARDGLVFANWRNDNHAEMDSFFRAFEKKTGIDVKVLHSSPSELIKVIHKSPRPYTLILMHFDSVRPEHISFLEPFFSGDGYLDFTLPALAPLYKKLRMEQDVAKKMDIGNKLAQGVRDMAVVLPVYQDEKSVYFPPDIKNINVGRGFSEYPEIGDFRW